MGGIQIRNTVLHFPDTMDWSTRDLQINNSPPLGEGVGFVNCPPLGVRLGFVKDPPLGDGVGFVNCPLDGVTVGPLDVTDDTKNASISITFCNFKFNKNYLKSMKSQFFYYSLEFNQKW